MTAKKHSPSLDFYRGRLEDFLENTGRQPNFTTKAGEEALWPLQIGAMVFLGELLEAENIFKRALKQKPRPEELAQARFFIGIGHVRISQYARALELFEENQSLSATLNKRTAPLSSNLRIQFFAQQGMAFFAFFKAEYRQSLSLAQRAYEAAFEIDFIWGMAFSKELIAHCHCQLGEVHRGLEDFTQSIGWAKKLGDGGLLSSFEIAREKFKAQFGIDHENTPKNLLRAAATLSLQDTYSLAEIYLELSRQLVLRGKCTEAKQLLDLHSDVIYKHQNRRHSAIFNLRYAHILFIQNEARAALNLLRSSQGSLIPEVDRLYLTQLQGLEAKIAAHLNTSAAPTNPNPPLNSLDERIRRRKKEETGSATHKSAEDFIGDQLDLAVQMRSTHLDDIIRNGLWGLIPTNLGLSPGENFIYMGPTRGMLIAADRGDVHLQTQGITTPMLKILHALSSGELRSKESLVEEVWGYEYRPDRHDSLLQATVGKIRKVLGPFSAWLEWHQGGYQLKPGVRLLTGSEIFENERKTLPDINKKFSATANQVGPKMALPDLNHRQILALKILNGGEFLGVREYARHFKVSTMTACRDLTILCNKNLIKKYGRARATHYGSIENAF